uniref:NIDO domain-containing protein n=1 Tax=Denticeps clupeoides TaxID=299321 RepID=A0AAY4D7M0_9TELE
MQPPGVFYPFGPGDCWCSHTDDGSCPLIPLSESFHFFGLTYRQIFVNNNGHLTFNTASGAFRPDWFPSSPVRDIIAPFWTDIDTRQNGNVYYQQYTSGDVLQAATLNINQYFPNVTFNASWVLVATWDRVAYYPTTPTVSYVSNIKYNFLII